MGQQGWIGIDCGQRTIKLAQLRKQAGRLELVAASLVPRNEATGAVEGPACPDAREIAAARLSHESLKGKHAASVLPMSGCEIRPVTLPDSVALNHPAAVQRALHEKYRWNLHDFEFGAWHVHPSAVQRPGNDNAYVLASHKEWTRRIAQQHRRAGLNCHVLDGLPMTLARALQISHPESASKPIAVLDWGYESTTFEIVCGGQPSYVRPFRDVGLKKIVAHLQSSLDLTIEEVEALLARSYGPSPALSRQAAASSPGVRGADLLIELLRPAMSDLLSELKRTLSYVKSHHSALDQPHLIMTGGGAAVAAARRILENDLEIKVAPWQPSLTVPDHLKPMLPLLANAIALSYLTWNLN